MSSCINYFSVTESSQDPEQHIIVYNPLAWNISTFINVTVPFPMAAVYDEDGRPVPAQVAQTPHFHRRVQRNMCTLVFSLFKLTALSH